MFVPVSDLDIGYAAKYKVMCIHIADPAWYSAASVYCGDIRSHILEWEFTYEDQGNNIWFLDYLY